MDARINPVTNEPLAIKPNGTSNRSLLPAASLLPPGRFPVPLFTPILSPMKRKTLRFDPSNLGNVKSRSFAMIAMKIQFCVCVCV